MTVHPLLRKISLSVSTGAVPIVVGALSDTSVINCALIGFFLGGVVLVVQYLIDFGELQQKTAADLNDRMRKLEEYVHERLTRVDRAVHMMERVDQLARDLGVPDHPIISILNGTESLKVPSPIAGRLAVEEIDALFKLMNEISGRGVTEYKGEDQNWLLALTRSTQKHILAISTATVDGGSRNFRGGFWSGQIGQAYLAAQHAAVRRQVVVRRIFILKGKNTVAPQELLDTCAMHRDRGIEVRILRMVPPVIDDFILFDDGFSYETSPAGKGFKTELWSKPDHIVSRAAQFADLWEKAERFETSELRS